MNKYGISPVDCENILAGSKIPTIKVFPVVLKVDSDKVLHKSDKQALVLNIKTQVELETAIAKLRVDFPIERLIVQPMSDKHAEIILGIKKDDIFGPVIVYGLGGIFTEIFKMVNFMIPPMSSANIKDQLLKSKISFLFSGARGQKVCDIDEFVTIIEGLMSFALENASIKEFDINPLFLYNNGKRASAVDIKIIL